MTTSCVVSHWLPSTGQVVIVYAHLLQNVWPHLTLITGSEYNFSHTGHFKWPDRFPTKTVGSVISKLCTEDWGIAINLHQRVKFI